VGRASALPTLQRLCTSPIRGSRRKGGGPAGGQTQRERSLPRGGAATVARRGGRGPLATPVAPRSPRRLTLPLRRRGGPRAAPSSPYRPVVLMRVAARRAAAAAVARFRRGRPPRDIGSHARRRHGCACPSLCPGGWPPRAAQRCVGDRRGGGARVSVPGGRDGRRHARGEAVRAGCLRPNRRPQTDARPRARPVCWSASVAHPLRHRRPVFGRAPSRASPTRAPKRAGDRRRHGLCANPHNDAPRAPSAAPPCVTPSVGDRRARWPPP